MENSFARAAERLEMSPQLISKYVAGLEESLGVRLFNRTTRKVSLTEVGNLYFQRARELVEGVDDLENQLHDLQSSATGRLRLSAPVSFATLYMSDILLAFQREYPNILVDIQLNDRQVDIVEEGFDLAIRIGRLQDSALMARKVADIRLVTCASPDYLATHGVPDSPEDLVAHRLLGYSYQQQAHDVLSQARPALLSNNGELLCQQAVAGAGIVMQPDFICGKALAAGQLTEILSESAPPTLGLYLVYTHRTLTPVKVRCFIDFMLSYFAEGVPWHSP